MSDGTTQYVYAVYCSTKHILRTSPHYLVSDAPEVKSDQTLILCLDRLMIRRRHKLGRQHRHSTRWCLRQGAVAHSKYGILYSMQYCSQPRHRRVNVTDTIVYCQGMLKHWIQLLKDNGGSTGNSGQTRRSHRGATREELCLVCVRA